MESSSISAAEFYSISECPLYLEEYSSDAIFSYIDLLTESHGGHQELHFYHENVKGLKMYKDHFVSKIMHSEEPTVITVKASVAAEMKKSVSYSVQVAINKISLKITSGKCGCPGGIDPAACKHVFAILHALEDYSRQRLFEAPTEKLQVWNRPKKTKLEPVLSNQIKFTSKEVGQRTFEPLQPVNFSALKSEHLKFSLCHVLRKVDFDAEKIKIAESIPLPAFPFSGYPELQVDFMDYDKIAFLHKYIVRSIEEYLTLEANTTEQSNCMLWKVERKYRLTASNFSRVHHRKSNFDKLCKDMCTPRDIGNIPAVRFGRENEVMVRNWIERKLSAIIRKCGLVVSPLYPYLAASPDGLLRGKDGEFMLVEIKCVWNPNILNLEQLMHRVDAPGQRLEWETIFKNEPLLLRANTGTDAGMPLK